MYVYILIINVYLSNYKYNLVIRSVLYILDQYLKD